MFHQVNGFDEMGNPLKRLITTMIQILDGPPPIVSIDKINLKVSGKDQLHIKCKVVSLTSCKIELKQGNEQLKSWNSK